MEGFGADRARGGRSVYRSIRFTALTTPPPSSASRHAPPRAHPAQARRRGLPRPPGGVDKSGEFSGNRSGGAARRGLGRPAITCLLQVRMVLIELGLTREECSALEVRARARRLSSTSAHPARPLMRTARGQVDLYMDEMHRNEAGHVALDSLVHWWMMRAVQAARARSAPRPAPRAPPPPSLPY